MTYPITPDPSVHNVPASVTKANQLATQQELQALAQALSQAFTKLILGLLTGGVLGGSNSNSATASTQLGNIFQNLLAAVNGSGSALNQNPATFNVTTFLTNWVNTLIAPLNLLVPNSTLQSLIDGVVGGSGNTLSTLINTLVSGTLSVDWSRIGMVPVSAIGLGNPTPNLILNGSFNASNALNGSGIWTWDGTTDHTGITGSGSAKVTADGTAKVLVSNPVQVTQGQVLNVSGYTMWSGLTATGSPIWLGLQTYLNGTVVSSPVVQSITSPGASGAWSLLTGSYTVPAGVDTVRTTINVGTTATAGSVWFDDLTKTKSGLMQGSWMNGINTTVAQDLQDLVDHIHNGVNGTNTTGNPLSSVLTNLQTHTNNIQGITDNVVQALTGGSSTNNPISSVKTNLLAIPYGNIVGNTTGGSVTHDATGTGGANNTSASGSLSTSWTHTIGAGANYVVAGVTFGIQANPTTVTRTVTYGGVAMNSLGFVALPTYFGTYQGFIELFGLANPPSGAQTVSVTGTHSGTWYNVWGNTSSYSGWAATGSAQTVSVTGGQPTSTVTSATNHMPVQFMVYYAQGSTSETLSAYSQTSLWNSGTMYDSSAVGSSAGILGDAAGASSLTFSATSSSTSGGYYAAIAVDLSP